MVIVIWLMGSGYSSSRTGGWLSTATDAIIHWYSDAETRRRGNAVKRRWEDAKTGRQDVSEVMRIGGY
jgi:hypothetical protein